tara:strand:+ start:2648 stop:2908 length:261 start_codon:yes stop_codon:yes gene_type:complete
MAFIRTNNIVADNGDVYANIEEFQAAHGPCGMEHPGAESCTMVLNAGKNGVQVALTFTDEAAHDAYLVDVASATTPGVTWTLVSAE